MSPYFIRQSGGLFGRNEAWRTQHLARLRQFRICGKVLGQTEVGDARLVEGIQEDVGWLEIAMQYTSLMGVVDGLSNGSHVIGSASSRQWIVAHYLSQIRPFNEFHRKVVVSVLFTDLIDRDDVRVLQASSSAS